MVEIKHSFAERNVKKLKLVQNMVLMYLLIDCPEEEKTKTKDSQKNNER